MTGKLTLTAQRRNAVAMMVEIARKPRKTPVSLADVAATIGVSLSSLEKYSAELRPAGLLKSFRGPGGGYMLTKPASEISILDIAASIKDLAGESDSEEDDGSYFIPSGQDLWDQLDICRYLLLQHISLADIVRGNLHAHPVLKGIRDYCDQAGGKTSPDTDTGAQPTRIAA